MDGYFLNRSLELILFLIIGSVMGSFLHVVSLNIGQLKTIVSRRSKCPHCEHELAWYELIPIFSYLVQRGRCRQCGESIPARYFWAELATAALYGSLYWWVAPSLLWWQFILLLGVVSIWVILFLDDWRTMSIDLGPISWLGAGLALLLVLSRCAVIGSWWPLWSALGGALTGWVVLAFIRWAGTIWLKQEAMGSGDPWVAAMIGLTVGWVGVAVMLLLSFIIGSLIGLIPMLLKSRFDTLKAVPFVPALFIAAWFTLLWGDQFIHWYTNLL